MITTEVLEEEGANSNTDSEQYLTFMLAEEEYGVEILCVEGIKGWTKVTPLPNTPSCILGVINLRGTIVPIIDLRKRFGIAEIPFNSNTVVIVVKIMLAGKQRTVGMVADGVSEVYRIENSDIRPSPEFDSTVDIDFVKGLSIVNERLVILLDVEKLIEDSFIEKVICDEDLVNTDAI